MKPKGDPIKWSPQIAYVVGLLVTDGNLSSDGRHLIMVSKDVQLLETFKECLNLKNKISLKMSGYTKKKNCHKVQFGNIILYSWLLNIGLMPNKTKRIGSLKIPKKYFFDFLRGHLDGDGCIRKYQDSVYPNSQRLYINFLSASARHIKWLQRQINILIGINGSIRQKDSVYSLDFAKKESLILLQHLYYKTNVCCLKRKYNIAEEFISKPR